MLYLWFRHFRDFEARRYAYIEWDTLATLPLEQYYAAVWDADAAAAQVKTPETTPQWEWFRLQGPRMPERLRRYTAGLAPLNGVLLSHAALQAVCDLEIPKNIFSELRLGTMLRSCGIPLRSFEPKHAATNQWRADLITISDEPGVYHPVKSLLPERCAGSSGASRDAATPSDRRAGRALSVTVQMPRRETHAVPKPQVVASRAWRPGTVLFTWELGGGIGHLMQTLPLARELKRRGHRVVVAARDLSRAHAIFDENSVELLQAPFKPGRAACPVESPCTFAHLLHNVGYSKADELAGLTSAWRTLLDLLKPDVIAADHSPTALLAARGLPIRRVPTGLGFFCPPDQSPLPNLRSWERVDPCLLEADERAVLERINANLIRWGQSPLDRISQLFAEVDDTFLMTYRELDHYPNRSIPMRYRGTWLHTDGQAPLWPTGKGKRIYAYLKNFPALRSLLEHLNKLGCPTLVFVDGIDRRIQEQFVSPTLRFETQRLDLRRVGQECDLAILNANHGTACNLLLAGKPMLLLPITLEQALLAESIVHLGAGLQADAAKAQQIIEALDRVLASNQFTQAAAAFAARYANHDPIRENEEMVSRLEELIAQG